jgi:predicted CoA-binding protein
MCLVSDLHTYQPFWRWNEWSTGNVRKVKDYGFLVIVNGMKPELAKEKSQEYFKSKVLAELKISEERIQLNELHRKLESIESQLQMLKEKKLKTFWRNSK